MASACGITRAAPPPTTASAASPASALSLNDMLNPPQVVTICRRAGSTPRQGDRDGCRVHRYENPRPGFTAVRDESPPNLPKPHRSRPAAVDYVSACLTVTALRPAATARFG